MADHVTERSLFPELEDAPAMKTTEIYADTRGRATCRGEHCATTIEWAELVGTKQRMCFDVPLVALATRHDANRRLIEVVDLSTNHWASCPDAPSFKRVSR
jgi:hypothetical protein